MSGYDCSIVIGRPARREPPGPNRMHFWTTRTGSRTIIPASRMAIGMVCGRTSVEERMRASPIIAWGEPMATSVATFKGRKTTTRRPTRRRLYRDRPAVMNEERAGRAQNEFAN